MKKKLFSLLALVMTVMTASAIDAPSYNLTVGENAQGSVKFYVAETEVTKAPEGATVTVVITPNTGWVVNQPSGQWYAAMAKAPRRAQAGIDMLNGFELTKSTTAENTWSFVMQRANAEVSVTYKKLLTHEDIGISGINDLTYNGQAQTPAVTVTDGEYTLVPGTDYNISYSDNTNAGEATATLKGTGDNYAGEWVMNFTIQKAALTVTANNKSVTFGDDAPTYTESYDGFVNNETKAVLSGTLAFACDYVKNQTAAGTYDITPSGLTSSNYDITFTKGTLTVGKKALESSMIAAIDPLTYTGNALTPEPVVTFNGMTLVKGTDYTVSYADNVNPGTATVTVTAVTSSKKYAGTTTKEFKINKANAMVAFGMPYKYEKTYGDPNFTILPEVIGDGTLTYRSGNEKILTVDERTGEVTIIGVGKARVWAEMSDGDNYIADHDWYEVTVSPKALTEDMIGDIAEQNYTGEALTPEVVVSDGEAVLEESTDYTVAYSDNTDLGQATVTVTGTGNYTGKVTKTFDIAMAQLTLDEVNDNSAELLDADGKWFDVTLKRTLSAGSWNTFAVPFDIDTPDGWTVKSLQSSSLEDGVLTLTFADAQSIEAGQPYLVKVEKDVDLSEQTFVGVKVSAESKPTETDGADLIPTLGKTAIEGEKESVLFLGADNKLYRPAELPADMKGFRAYFLLKGEAATAQEVRMDMGDATGITTTKYTNYTNDEFFDLSGRKVSKAVKGVYIVNGKRVVVK